MAHQKIRKAVFPAAGMGTRFLPATKSIPKEMLCLVDKPLIQYGVEEAVAAGCTEIIIVTGRDKGAVEDHFDCSPELEAALAAKGKQTLLDALRSLSKLAKIVYTRQAEPLGLGHAILMAKELVGDEPFCVLLPDDIIDARVPCMKQMVEAFEETQASILASEVIEGPAISNYGCLDCTPVRDRPAAAGGEGDGGEAEVRGGAVGERHYWAIHPDAAHLPDDRGREAGRGRRAAIDRRHQGAAPAREGLRLSASRASATTRETSWAS